MILIEKLKQVHCNALAGILSMDVRLHVALEKKGALEIITPQECYRHCVEWQSRKQGQSYVIIEDDTPIGMISYVQNAKDASCGYWIASKYWNKGKMTEAFGLFLLEVKSLGIISLSAKISLENDASIRIWKHYNAEIKEDGVFYNPKILLDFLHVPGYNTYNFINDKEQRLR